MATTHDNQANLERNELSNASPPRRAHGSHSVCAATDTSSPPPAESPISLNFDECAFLLWGEREIDHAVDVGDLDTARSMAEEAMLFPRLSVFLRLKYQLLLSITTLDYTRLIEMWKKTFKRNEDNVELDVEPEFTEEMTEKIEALIEGYEIANAEWRAEIEEKIQQAEWRERLETPGKAHGVEVLANPKPRTMKSRLRSSITKWMRLLRLSRK
ncbi:hypothetical protein HDK77DRAFT_200742 [Phyllosticta capitalensis]